MDIETTEISEFEFNFPGFAILSLKGPILMKNPSELKNFFIELNVNIPKITSLVCEDESKSKLL